jgi:hypothetical protein
LPSGGAQGRDQLRAGDAPAAAMSPRQRARRSCRRTVATDLRLLRRETIGKDLVMNAFVRVETSMTTVANVRTVGLCAVPHVYVGRPSRWGNPFRLRNGATSAERADCNPAVRGVNRGRLYRGSAEINP